MWLKHTYQNSAHKLSCWATFFKWDKPIVFASILNWVSYSELRYGLGPSPSPIFYSELRYDLRAWAWVFHSKLRYHQLLLKIKKHDLSKV